jgi:hypothetical protein
MCILPPLEIVHEAECLFRRPKVLDTDTRQADQGAVLLMSAVVNNRLCIIAQSVVLRLQFVSSGEVLVKRIGF